MRSMGRLQVGDRLAVAGDDMGGADGGLVVGGRILSWIGGGDAEPACVVELDAPITATGVMDQATATVTGTYLVLTLRYVGAAWRDSETVHVELCDVLPGDASPGARRAGAWIESHGIYRRLG